MFENDDNTASVSTLVTTMIDSINGYRDAAANAESSQFQELFRSMADERSAVVEDLRREVAQVDGDAPDDGSIMGKTHQRFLDLKAAITGRDDKAIINEVERGEDYLKEKFEAVLSNQEGMSPSLQAALQRAWESVREGHDKVSQLKHALADQ
jgi:uncharacterized protein (TIGR02284 family)